MKKFIFVVYVIMSMFLISSCDLHADSQASKTAQKVESQQAQYEKVQPTPFFHWSQDRHLLIQLYHLRNREVATYSVWRSNTGMIEGDCPSIGYAIPYDSSLTNPLSTTDEDQKGNGGPALAVIEQAEPNGIFASKNSIATWVMCAGEFGNIEPILVESKVTTYPYQVKVDYDKNRVTKSGKSSINLTVKK